MDNSPNRQNPGDLERFQSHRRGCVLVTLFRSWPRVGTRPFRARYLLSKRRQLSKGIAPLRRNKSAMRCV
jgi:hypothetical protein